MTWGVRRKLLYTVCGCLVLLGAGLSVYNTYFNAPPSCTDGKRNEGETGIDCGGPCAALCAQEARAPVALWARPFLVASSTYTVAAYVQNLNVGAAARRARYSFQLFDKNNALVATRDGVIDLPPVQTIPIVETNINVGYRKPVRALFSFSEEPRWQRVSAGDLPSLTIKDDTLASDGTRLAATLTNSSYTDAPSVIVNAVLFDERDVALAASKTVVSVDAKSSAPIVFTWPQPVLGITHAEIRVLPPF